MVKWITGLNSNPLLRVFVPQAKYPPPIAASIYPKQGYLIQPANLPQARLPLSTHQSTQSKAAYSFDLYLSKQGYLLSTL